MRKTFKKIGIGLLTTALTVSNIPVGKIPAKAEMELLTEKKSESGQEEASDDNLNESEEKVNVNSGESETSGKSEDDETDKEQKEESTTEDKSDDGSVEETGTETDEVKFDKSGTDEAETNEVESSENETGKAETDEAESNGNEIDKAETDEVESDESKAEDSESSGKSEDDETGEEQKEESTAEDKSDESKAGDSESSGKSKDDETGKEQKEKSTAEDKSDDGNVEKAGTETDKTESDSSKVDESRTDKAETNESKLEDSEISEDDETGGEQKKESTEEDKSDDDSVEGAGTETDEKETNEIDENKSDENNDEKETEENKEEKKDNNDIEKGEINEMTSDNTDETLNQSVKTDKNSTTLQKADEKDQLVFTEKSLKRKSNGEVSFSLKNRDIEENTYAIQISVMGSCYGYQIFIDGKKAGQVLCKTENEELMDYISEDSFNLTGKETIMVKPLDKKQGNREELTGEIIKIELIFSDEIYPDEDGISLMAFDSDEEGVYVYEAEDYYAGEIQTDGDVEFGDMQPNEEIEISLGEDFKPGKYRLTIRSNGNRTEYEVEVNGENIGKVTRETSGWDAVDLTDDSLAELLSLSPGDTIKIIAPSDYGKVDFIALTFMEEQEQEPTIKPEPKPGNWDYVYEAEDYYAGEIQTDGDVKFGDMQPNEEIEISLGEDFKPGKYRLTIRSNGNRTEYAVEVNGENVGKVTRNTSGWDAVDLTDDSLDEILSLSPGDTIKITALSNYGKVDFIALTTEEGEPFEEKDKETGITVSAGVGVIPEGYGLIVETQSEEKVNHIESICHEKGIAYAVGTFYYIGLQKLTRSTEELGNGKATIRIPLPEGYQENAIRFIRIAEEDTVETIKGNIEDGQVVLTITVNKLDCIFGILDMRGITDGHYIYEAEKYYTGAGENMTASDDPDVKFSDIKPGEVMTIPVSDQDLPEGNYKLTIRSNGTRTGYAFYINGVPAGTVKRAESGWEAKDLTSDQYDGVLHLKSGDEIQIKATKNKNEGDGELFGKIDYIILSETSETPKTPGVLEKIVLRSSDWYFGKVDNESDGSVNLRPDDQIDYFIRQEDGFSEEGNKYRLTIQAGGMRTEYIILVNGKEAGSLSRPDTEWGVLNESQLGRTVTLKAGDILTVYAPDGNWGTIADITLDKVDKNAPQILQAEDFYGNSDGIQTDGGVRMCDVQPGESVDFIIPEDFEEGYYRLAALSNGTRMAYLVSINGKPLGLIRRNTTGWDAADLTEDLYSGVLKLKAGDILTLTATMNLDEGDNLTFGKLDAVILTGTLEPEAPQERDKITLYAADWYGGSQDSSGGMNIRPGDGMDFIIREEDGFTEGDYLIALRASGFRKNYTIKVNGQPVMDISLRNSEWGEYLTGTALSTIHLKPGDVVTFYEAESWGCIDYVTFYKGDVPSGNLMSERTGGRLKPMTYEGSQGEKASGTEPVFIYQGEGYYQKQSDNPAADLQPGEQIEIPLADNDNFVDGLYQVTVVSCGVRDHMFVKVNGQKTGRIDRVPGDYGMDKMSSDQLESTITLHKGDLLCIEAAPEGWGWVDYIRLDLVQKSEEVSQGKRYTYRAMDYYSKKQADSDTADLQPGEKIVIPIADESFEEGYYLVSVTSCGGREKMSVEINGQESGWIHRNANNYGIRALTRDTMLVPVYLKYGDQVSICAPSNGGWAWVGQVDLIKAVE